MRISTFASLLLTTYYLLFASTVFASEIYLGIGEPDEKGVHDVAVILRTTTPINALEGILSVGAIGGDIEISDAESPVQFWIERPQLKNDNIHFSGIIPGGFAGEAVLFHIFTTLPPAQFTINKDSLSILQNDGAGTPLQATVGKSAPLPSKFILGKIADDTNEPMPFELSIMSLPTEEGEKPALVWNTHDDESGIVRFEIAFSEKEVSPIDLSLQWEEVESGIPLTSQQLQKFIYVKAIDRGGNVRMSTFSPSDHISRLKNYKNIMIFSILSIALFFGVFFLHRKWALARHNAKAQKT